MRKLKQPEFKVGNRVHLPGEGYGTITEIQNGILESNLCNIVVKVDADGVEVLTCPNGITEA